MLFTSKRLPAPSAAAAACDRAPLGHWACSDCLPPSCHAPIPFRRRFPPSPLRRSGCTPRPPGRPWCARHGGRSAPRPGGGSWRPLTCWPSTQQVRPRPRLSAGWCCAVLCCADCSAAAGLPSRAASGVGGMLLLVQPSGQPACPTLRLGPPSPPARTMRQPCTVGRWAPMARLKRPLGRHPPALPGGGTSRHHLHAACSQAMRGAGAEPRLMCTACTPLLSARHAGYPPHPRWRSPVPIACFGRLPPLASLDSCLRLPHPSLRRRRPGRVGGRRRRRRWRGWWRWGGE